VKIISGQFTEWDINFLPEAEMKLFTRTNLYYIIFSLFAFIVGGLVFYHNLNRIIDDRIEEDLRTEKMLIETEINHFDSIPDYQSLYGHLLQIKLFDHPRKYYERLQDTVMFDMKLEVFHLYRHLRVESTSEDGKGYIVNLFKPLDSRKKLSESIFISLVILFLVLLGFLIFTNYVIIRRVWVSFYRTLDALNRYDLNAQVQLHLPKTNIQEFRHLNDTLHKMSEKILQDYQNLKEFNENAAHELQTPLAIIKSKLDLLIQNEQMDKSQLDLIHSVYEATSRMSKLNQGLLLISRIQNNQFNISEDINIELFVDNTIQHFQELIDLKGIKVEKHFTNPMVLHMNHALAEILLNNLISNAIRHNIQDGIIKITIRTQVFEISNTGPELNIDPQQLFERFRKSDSRSESVGLGLSIVHKICTLYRWTIKYNYFQGSHTLTISR
jgi:signal transduction histidine kinase